MSPAPLGRKVSPNFLLRFKASFRRLKDACGGQESAAMVTRVSHQTISRYGVIQEPILDDQNFPPADVLMDLMLDSGNVAPLREMADEIGYVLVPKANAAGVDRLLEIIGTISREAGDVVGDAAVAIADGHLDPAECGAIKEGIRRSMEALVALERCVAEAGKPA